MVGLYKNLNRVKFVEVFFVYNKNSIIFVGNLIIKIWEKNLKDSQ